MDHLLDENTRRGHKHRNRLHSVLLLLGIGVLLGLSAMLLWGWAGLVWAGLATVLLLILAPRVSPDAVMRMYRAREVDSRFGPVGRVLDIISERAELPARPRLFVIPSTTLNAFATGSAGNASIAITEGLLRTLSLRELAGVLAHEVSHVRNNDLWVMGLADAMSRFTQALSTTAVLLAGFNFVGMLAGITLVSWWAILLLYLAPLVSSLLQLGLSRAREYDADLEGALLTGDPRGLVSALRKLERYTGRFWEDLMFPVPGRRVPHPSLLRSHPRTEDRIARLLELETRPKPPPIIGEGEAAAAPAPWRDAPIAPRLRWPGVWY
ncbi:MAG: M48 family metalloprotease [Hyphomicrobiaceae bacterium]|nr:M48 family metalloprotease [Hyphomicrobiaceae bacterium]